MYVVYGLEDPRDHLYHYVGITEDVYARFSQHVTGDGRNIEKNGWIFECRQANIMIIMREIERVQILAEAKQREIFWIKYYLNSGHPLHNSSIAKSILNGINKLEEKKRRIEEEIRALGEQNRTLEEKNRNLLAMAAKIVATPTPIIRNLPVSITQDLIQEVLDYHRKGFSLRSIVKATSLTYYQIQKITSEAELQERKEA